MLRIGVSLFFPRRAEMWLALGFFATLLSILVAGFHQPGVAQTVQGRFVDQETQAPVEGALVVLVGTDGWVHDRYLTNAEGQLYRLTLETVQEVIRLEGITVQGEQQCVVRPGEGLELARVWEEARKALTVEDWTQREGMYRFHGPNERCGTIVLWSR